MRNYLRNMKHVIGLAGIIAALVAGMAFAMAGNAAAAPAGLGIANERSDFNRLNFDGAFIRPALVRPAFNPFFGAPAINPFFGASAINPFFGASAISPFFNPFLDVNVDVNGVAPFGVAFD